MQKIAVRQLDASRPCRRAGRVLEKHRVVGVDALLTAAQHVVGDAGRRRERVRPREDAGRPTIVEERYPLQLREAPARDVPRTGAGELGATAAEERQLIDVAGTLAQEERGRIRVLEDEREIVGAAQGIDRDQHGADLRGRELDEHPLRPVRRPERDVVAALDPEPDERLRELLDAGEHVAVRPAHTRVREDERLAMGRAARDAVEEIADRDRLHATVVPSMVGRPPWRTRSIAR